MATRQRFPILSSILLIQYMTARSMNVDKVAHVCSAFNNVCTSVVEHVCNGEAVCKVMYIR